MKRDEIQVGDAVNVEYASIDADLQCRVLSAPSEGRPWWALMTTRGTLLYVQDFARMARISGTVDPQAYRQGPAAINTVIQGLFDDHFGVGRTMLVPNPDGSFRIEVVDETRRDAGTDGESLVEAASRRDLCD